VPVRLASVLSAFLVFGLFPVQAFQTAAASSVEITPRIRPEAPPAGPVPAAHLRVDASLVLVNAQGTTPSGAPVRDLTKEDFRVFEDGTEQSIQYFTREDAPVSVGVLVDSSASMRDKKDKLVEAATALFRTANAADEFFLIEFDEKPRIEEPFTTSTDLLARDISRMRPFGRTSLFDAIHMAFTLMKNAAYSRKALVILSDGGDNRSRHTFAAIKNEALESDVPIYAMGIFGPEGETPSSPEEATGPDLLRRLAELTGGRHFPVKVSQLPEIGATIGELLREQYVLGYSPTNAQRDGRYREIKLELAAPTDPPVLLRYRRGYYAPSR
jgi:Ca-activated chloride channel homolog